MGSEKFWSFDMCNEKAEEIKAIVAAAECNKVSEGMSEGGHAIHPKQRFHV